MRKALITGASSGIGRELAILLAEKNVSLILHGRDIDALEALSKEIGSKTPVKICLGELASFEGTQEILKVLRSDFPDIVINNAGFGLYGDLVAHGPQVMQEMIAANCAAVVAICQHIAYWWEQEKVPGTILNVSSALSFLPSPGAAVYGATKAFINSFSAALDIELESKGIRVLTACPGRVATQFVRRATRGKVQSLTKGGSILDPKEVAKAIVHQLEHKNPLQIIDWRYKLLLFIEKLVPKRFAMKRLYKALKSRA